MSPLLSDVLIAGIRGEADKVTVDPGPVWDALRLVWGDNTARQILAQRPDATFVASFPTWVKAGRRPHGHGIKILPVGHRSLITVFDVSQTTQIAPGITL